MKRLGIFCLYTPNGEVDDTVLFTIKEFRRIVEYLVVVVNGDIDGRRELESYADTVEVRENRGYDIGAYKNIILSPKYIDRVKSCDELILCNSSFYGPFIPFEDIFKEMERKQTDFWGISSCEKNLVQHIQTYFLVFRHTVLEGDVFFSYLRERVDEDKIDYFDACSIFENGLFFTLRRAGYQFGAYKRDISCNNYVNPYGSVKLDGLPILKKKIFAKQFYNKERIVSALSYVMDTYDYDVSHILRDADRRYGIELRFEDLKLSIQRQAERDLFQKIDMVDRREIEDFIQSKGRVFIYGNGKMAKHIFSCFFFYENNQSLEGFIVSDDQPLNENRFKGYPIRHISELEPLRDKSVIVALNQENTIKVAGNLRGAKDVKFLWRR